jgi:hypothetical protein
VPRWRCPRRRPARPNGNNRQPECRWVLDLLFDSLLSVRLSARTTVLARPHAYRLGRAVRARPAAAHGQRPGPPAGGPPRLAPRRRVRAARAPPPGQPGTGRFVRAAPGAPPWGGGAYWKPCEQRRTCWGPERLHFAPGPQPFLTGRAIRVPHPRVDPGTQRTTTVTSTPPTSWSSSPDQHERIPRICLIRMRSRRCRRSARPAGGGAPPLPSSAGRRRTTSTLLRRHTAAVRASRANGFALSGCASGDPGHHDPAGRQPTELDRRSVLTCEDGCRRLTVVGIARRRLTACRRPRRCMGAERVSGPPGGGLACCRHAPVPCGRLADNAPSPLVMAALRLYL